MAAKKNPSLLADDIIDFTKNLYGEDTYNELMNKPRPYYTSNDHDKYLSQFEWGDAVYDDARKMATDYLVNDVGLAPGDADDVLDAYITRETHYKYPTKRDAGARRKAGRFETGVEWQKAQDQARELLKQHPDAKGVLYGLRFEGEKAQDMNGLKNPIVAYGNDLDNIAKSLTRENKASKFQFDTLFNED